MLQPECLLKEVSLEDAERLVSFLDAKQVQFLTSCLMLPGQHHDVAVLMQPEAFAASQTDAALWSLAALCNRLSCTEMLEILDRAFAVRVGSDCPAAAQPKCPASAVTTANATSTLTAAGPICPL